MIVGDQLQLLLVRLAQTFPTVAEVRAIVVGCGGDAGSVGGERADAAWQDVLELWQRAGRDVTPIVQRLLYCAPGDERIAGLLPEGERRGVRPEAFDVRAPTREGLARVMSELLAEPFAVETFVLARYPRWYRRGVTVEGLLEAERGDARGVLDGLQEHTTMELRRGDEWARWEREALQLSGVAE